MEVEKAKYVRAEIPARMLCFEYLCNEGLDKHLTDESSGLEWNTRYGIIKGVCNGLNFLHEREIVHLDLKPQNILMDATMMPKIVDFGLSRLLGEQKSYTVTVTSNRAGTLGYMAPEYINKGEISKKADIFSLDVIIIEILKGCKDGYPDYHQNNETDFQHFTEKVLTNWRNRFERSSKYTTPELHTQLVKQCIDIALECVHPDKGKRPNVSNIIGILNAAEGSCSVQNGEDLLVDHQICLDADPHQTQDISDLVVCRAVPCRAQTKYISLSMATTAVVSEAFSVVGKVLVPLTDGLLKNWVASTELGDKVEALERELKLVKALLAPTVDREMDNSALKELLEELRELRYDADDMLDELDYFRIQDELDGTYHATDEYAKGCAHNLALNVRHTARAVGKQINCLHPCFSTSATTLGAKFSRGVNGCKAKLTSRSRCNPIHAVGKCFPCSSLPSDPDDDDSDKDDKVDYGMHNNSPQRNLITNNEPPKLTFDRVDVYRRMQDIGKKLRLLRQDVSSIIAIATLGSNWSTVPNIAQSCPITTSESIEPKLYGRDHIMNSIIHDITKGKYSGDALTVIPIVGLGGIGKTTLAQHIYHSGEVQEHFEVKVWTCVSHNFDVNTLLTKIEKGIPKINGEMGTTGELIGQRLKNKRFLLVLDDIWDCTNEDQWKQLLVPFRKSQAEGNVIMVTTRFPAQAQIMIKQIDHSIYLEAIDKTEFKELFLHIVFGDNLPPKHDTSILEIGNKIVDKLKGSPLAAETVGRLLKTDVDLDHWTRVLESKEWEQSDDIMPALKLSYDYLAPQLQRCFFYCALFPQDYKFDREELIKFWIGLDVLHSSFGENKRLEDIGLSHLMKLVNYGFFEKERKEDGSACYTIHDLLHELAWKVSSHECLSIKSSEVRSLQIPPSIRHLSISIDDTSVQDRLTLKNCVEDFRTLDKRLKFEKLRSLMLFGKHHYFLNTFGDLFRQAKALRVVLLTNANYDVEDLLHNFYNLLHLRYLRIQCSCLPRTRFSRFYHLMVLDAKHCYINNDLQRNMRSLVKLRHFLVRNDATHAQIVEVGKFKSLQELRQFVVKQDNQGFELRKIGKLVQLRGSLCIDNLENVQVKDEEDEAKLLQKNHLHELILRWNLVQSTNDSTLEEHVLETLKPSSNLLRLSIVGHRGAACPSWLGMNLSVKRLESLYLDGVAWKTFPPIGELQLVNVPHEDIVVNIPDIRFGNLRRLKLVNLPRLKTWALHAPCQLFPFLEVLIIKGCSQLEDMSFSHSAFCQQEKGAYVNFFPRPSKLKIQNCQQLLSFPPVPWTKASCSTLIEGTGSSCIHTLFCQKNQSEYILRIEGKDTADSMF